MRLNLITFLLIVISCALVSAETFAEFKSNFNKNYDGSQNMKSEADAIATFKKNQDAIEAHNKNKSESYLKGNNQFSDMTDAEIDKTKKGETNVDPTKITEQYAKENKKVKNGNTKNAPNIDPAKLAISKRTDSDKSMQAPALSIAKSMDLRKNVSPVKNQNSCGSCWAFLTVSLYEFEARDMNNTKSVLSEQSLVDCDTNNKGCEGGNSLVAIVHARINGIPLESNYKYTGKKGSCKKPFVKPLTHGMNACYLHKTTETEMLNVMNFYKQPIAVAIGTKGCGFNFYKSGVFDDSSCPKDKVDHAGLIVGYGTDTKAKKDFWIVKNTWGPSWGEKGYIRMVRDKNQCGLTTLPFILCKD